VLLVPESAAVAVVKSCHVPENAVLHQPPMVEPVTLSALVPTYIHTVRFVAPADPASAIEPRDRVAAASKPRSISAFFMFFSFLPEHRVSPSNTAMS
jgi:hypothetical protein